MTELDRLKEIITEAKSVVFFGGAGVSTASGIPDFRGDDGLYEKENKYDAPPEMILSGRYLYSKPESFYRYYKNEMIYKNAKPNRAHLALAELEHRGKLSAVITQNIDGLHQAAGSENVIELHGSVLRNYCTRCSKKFSLQYVLSEDGVPYCNECGGIVRPNVILYGEGLENQPFCKAELAISQSDVMIVGGTSLTVYPAASLVNCFKGDCLIIINKTETPYDRYADLVIREPIAEALGYAVFGE